MPLPASRLLSLTLPGSLSRLLAFSLALSFSGLLSRLCPLSFARLLSGLCSLPRLIALSGLLARSLTGAIPVTGLLAGLAFAVWLSVLTRLRHWGFAIGTRFARLSGSTVSRFPLTRRCGLLGGEFLLQFLGQLRQFPPGPFHRLDVIPQHGLRSLFDSRPELIDPLPGLPSDSRTSGRNPCCSNRVVRSSAWSVFCSRALRSES